MSSAVWLSFFKSFPARAWQTPRVKLLILAVVLSGCTRTFLSPLPEIKGSNLARCEDLAPPLPFTVSLVDNTHVTIGWVVATANFDTALIERSTNAGPWEQIATSPVADGNPYHRI